LSFALVNALCPGNGRGCLRVVEIEPGAAGPFGAHRPVTRLSPAHPAGFSP
jgi:hypothetical protein